VIALISMGDRYESHTGTLLFSMKIGNATSTFSVVFALPGDTSLPWDLHKLEKRISAAVVSYRSVLHASHIHLEAPGPIFQVLH